MEPLKVKTIGEQAESYGLVAIAHNQKRAALVAGVSSRTIARWRKKNLITPVVVDGIELYRHADLERIVNGTNTAGE